MLSSIRIFFFAFFMMALPLSAHAKDLALVEHAKGSENAPIRVDEYMSITCLHCAHFTRDTLPILEKKYINTGKVRFVVHDFPLNGLSLKAASVAQCLPSDQYFPFITTLFTTLLSSNFDGSNFENTIYQYAALGGLPLEKAKECGKNSAIQDAIIKDRSAAEKKYDIEATPLFVINNGEKVITGAQSVQNFSDIFDQLLAKKNNGTSSR